ncbi:uncharacterized protein LTR77_001895 [Saxophila tyrrhenica]|uniref:Zn(2)-C6 fungal-type domain-containing protein n=1 Tax=Saxophila tyrrhenica TaxID=1690608 RepID=A0AAV9PNE8_9PEZI|nr:hypothetical protein LTR77_001895 [Saxophila tyrrhenica]
MVGVAGRSKGCNTCKRRRIKCDERRPKCARCLKAGYKCAGYDRPLQVVLSTPHAAAEGKAKSSGKHTPGPLLHDQQEPNASLILAPFLPLPSKLKDDLQFAFVFQHLVWSSYASPWLQLSASGRLTALAHEAALAFSQSAFGRHHRLREIELSSAARYGRALKQLQTSLQKCNASETADLLVPVLILLMHSCSLYTTEESQVHVRGIHDLLRSCGPKPFQQEPLRAALSSTRATLVTLALIDKRRLFLEDARWREVPWSLAPVEKPAAEELVDMLVFLPGLTQDVEYQSRTTSDLLTTHLTERLVEIFQVLFRWRWAWNSRYPLAAWEEERQAPAVAGWKPAYPGISSRLLRFASPERASDVLLYNTILIMVLGLLRQLSSWVEVELAIKRAIANTQPVEAFARNTALNMPTAGITACTAAMEIARAFDYHLQPQRIQTPALYWLFPLGLAKRTLFADSAWRAFIDHMMETSRRTRGYGSEIMGGAGFGSYILRNCEMGLI